MGRTRAVVAGLCVLVCGVAAAAGAAAVPPGPVRGAAADDVSSQWTKEALQARFANPDAKATEDDYAGNAECKECHEKRWKSLGTSFHASLRSEKKSGTHGCETCHGPGRQHSDDSEPASIRHPEKVGAATSVASCVACHVEVLEKPVLGHRKWIEGRPDAEGRPTLRPCVTCHAIHVDKESPAFDPKVGPFATRAALDEVAKPVDAAVCSRCHTTYHPEMRRSGHAFLLKEGAQCAACHGNASLHAESGGDPRKIVRPDLQTREEADATCLGCHRDGDAMAKWTCSEHGREGVSCIQCHDANAARGKTLRGGEFELCGGCHLDVKAKLRLPNRHRVDSGRVKCSDCHDPHGNTSKMRDRDLRQRVCAECHVEKAGPFLFDHGIKRSEGCVACHDPHGSVNRRMLTYTQMKPMCLQCHPETPHDLSQRKYDNCITCHSEIHGSDLDRRFFK